jgi:uncharacterized cupin superfamily protein
MRRRSLDVLVAWLDASRRRDRDAMRTILSPDATWQGVRAGWVCSTPEEVIDTWLERAEALDDLDAVEMTAGDRRATLHLRAPSLAHVDPSLRRGVHIGFEIGADGRVTRLVDAAAAAQAEAWFVVNVADAQWKTGAFGAYTTFAGEVAFERIGVNIGVLEPGQPACWYHREGEQEDFLVLKGDALLLVEGEERRLRAWDFVHCPPWTEHVFIGAGAQPCTVLALGGRSGGGVVYPVSELALSHGAGVREQTTLSEEAYAGIPPDEPAAFDPGWLPGA